MVRRLENRVALITGGASGIGKAIALAFAQESADVCIADVNYVGAEETAREVEMVGRKSLAIQVDVTKFSDLDRMVTSTVKYFGKIDILVNDAGIAIFNQVLEVTEAEWNTMIDINLKGLFFATQRVLPIMLRQGKGKIINMASDFGAVGHRNASVYCASKAGIINLTKSLALELAPRKINVNAIGPALTNTPATQQFLTNADPFMHSLIGEIPLGRYAQPEEIVGAAIYLASDESDFVTGHTLFVDGGFLSQ